jgi:predicted ABC-type ATPase
MKLIEALLLEVRKKPKAVIMAGGAGSGKSFLLNQLELDSLQQFNPDKYVEDPDHPYHNKLGPASIQTEKDVLATSEEGTSLVWDTTASGKKFEGNVEKLKANGYEVYIVLVYTHPMIAYAKNFERGRNVPAAPVFATWRNAYQKIESFNKMANGNLSIFVNDHGIKDYLTKYNEKTGAGKSSFFQPVVMSKEEEEEFNKAVADFDYDRDNRSEDKAVKQAFLKAYNKNGLAPGDDQLRDVVKKFRDKKEKLDKDHEDVLESIADMLFNPKFQELLKHSTPAEINSKVQAFL